MPAEEQPPRRQQPPAEPVPSSNPQPPSQGWKYREDHDEWDSM